MNKWGVARVQKKSSKINVSVKTVPLQNSGVVYDLLAKLALREVQNAEEELRSATYNELQAIEGLSSIEQEMKKTGVSRASIDSEILNLEQRLKAKGGMDS